MLVLIHSRLPFERLLSVYVRGMPVDNAVDVFPSPYDTNADGICCGHGKGITRCK